MSGETTQTELILAEIRSLSTLGERDKAAEMLSGVIEDERPRIATSYRVFEMVSFTAFFIANLVNAEQAITAHFPNLGKVKISVSVDKRLPGPQIFQWESVLQAENNFEFHDTLFGLSQNELYTIFTRWLSFLQIADIYALSGKVGGIVYVDVGDWSSSIGLNFCDNKSDAYLIPDCSFLASKGYSETRKAYETNPVKWKIRHALALWRGSSTGRSDGGLMSLPRVKLCQLGLTLDGKDLLDVGITSIVQFIDPDEAESLTNSGVVRQHIPATEFNTYRYHIDIDGNTNSWPGLFQKLLTGSPVLKIASADGYRQWYYDRLIPWKNFVPVRNDLSDLLQKIRFLISNDELAQEIGRNALDLANTMDLSSEVVRSFDTIEGSFNAHRYRWT